MDQLSTVSSLASNDLVLLYDVDEAGSEKTKTITYSEFETQISGAISTAHNPESLYYNGEVRVTATTEGFSLTGQASEPITFASESDGDLVIKNFNHGRPIYIFGEDASGSTKYIAAFDPDGPASLYNAGLLALSTGSQGINVRNATRTIFSVNDSGYNYTDPAGSGQFCRVSVDGTGTVFSMTGGGHGSPYEFEARNAGNTATNTTLKMDPDGAAELYYAGTKVLETHDTGINVYDTSGTAPKVIFRDSSNNFVGRVWMSSDSMFLDNGPNSSGESTYLRGYDGVSTYDILLKATQGGSVDLYYDGTKMIETANYGLSFGANTISGTGDIYCNDIHTASGTVYIGDLKLSSGDSGLLINDTAPSFSAVNNIIINGDFNIWQRGTTFAAIASAAFCTDRWQYYKVGTAVHTISRDTDVPTQTESGHYSNYSLKVDCTTIDSSISAGDFTVLEYAVEGYDYQPLAGKYGTLSFWVKATKTGTYCISFRNNSSTRSYIAEYTVNSSDVWEKKTITVLFDETGGGTWDYTNGLGIGILFSISCGSTYQTTPNAWQAGNYLASSNQVNGTDSTSNNFRLAQIQLEVGEEATTFQSRSIAEDLALCQRYFQKPLTGLSQGRNVSWYMGGSNNGSLLYRTIIFPQEMRIAPTVTTYDPNGISGRIGYWSGGGGINNHSSFSLTIGTGGFWINATSLTNANGLRFGWEADAEL